MVDCMAVRKGQGMEGRLCLGAWVDRVFGDQDENTRMTRETKTKSVEVETSLGAITGFVQYAGARG